MGGGRLAGGGLGLLLYLILWVFLPEGEPGAGTSGAVQIAEERYARGEIGAEELARIRADLGAR